MATPRAIAGLEWVRWARKAPWPTPRRRKGAKARGIAYERKLAKKLGCRPGPPAAASPILRHGPWIEFCDRNGKGYAQPDILLEQEDRLLVIEVKYTQTARAWAQLNDLYLPLLSTLLPGRRLIPIQACKVLTEGGDVIETLQEARPGAIWHCLR